MFLGKNPGGIGAAQRRQEASGSMQGIESGGVNLMRGTNEPDMH